MTLRQTCGHLCPAHLDARPPRIEVINLDRWVSQFLKRRSFPREVAFFGEARDRLDQVCALFSTTTGCLRGCLSRSYAQNGLRSFQAKGLADQRGYLKASRGRPRQPPSIERTAALWDIFADIGHG